MIGGTGVLDIHRVDRARSRPSSALPTRALPQPGSNKAKKSKERPASAAAYHNYRSAPPTLFQELGVVEDEARAKQTSKKCEDARPLRVSVGTMKEEGIDWRKIDWMTRESRAGQGLSQTPSSRLTSDDYRAMLEEAKSTLPGRHSRGEDEYGGGGGSHARHFSTSSSVPPPDSASAFNTADNKVLYAVWEKLERMKKAVAVRLWLDEMQSKFPDRVPLEDMRKKVEASEGKRVSELDLLLRVHLVKGSPSLARFMSHAELVDATSDDLMEILFPFVSALDEGRRRAVLRQNHELSSKVSELEREKGELERRLSKAEAEAAMWRKIAEERKEELTAERAVHFEELKQAEEGLFKLERMNRKMGKPKLVTRLSEKGVSSERSFRKKRDERSYSVSMTVRTPTKR